MVRYDVELLESQSASVMSGFATFGNYRNCLLSIDINRVMTRTLRHYMSIELKECV